MSLAHNATRILALWLGLGLLTGCAQADTRIGYSVSTGIYAPYPGPNTLIEVRPSGTVVYWASNRPPYPAFPVYAPAPVWHSPSHRHGMHHGHPMHGHRHGGHRY